MSKRKVAIVTDSVANLMPETIAEHNIYVIPQILNWEGQSLLDQIDISTAQFLSLIHIFGVNNRNLQTFEVDFDTTARLRALIPPEIAVVGESGLKTADDVAAMRAAGVDAVLVLSLIHI